MFLLTKRIKHWLQTNNRLKQYLENSHFTHLKTIAYRKMKDSHRVKNKKIK